MGTFLGHVLPGCFCIILGTWWTIQIYRRFYQASLKRKLNIKGETFKSTPTFPVKTPAGVIDIEVYAVVTSCIVGLLIELVIVTSSDHPDITPSNMHHATMYFCFALAFLSAAVFPKIKILPEGYNHTYMLLTSAYAIEGLLFKYHNLDSGALHLLMHVLLQYAVWGCCLATLLEMLYPENLWLPLARAFFTLVQGTWFWQIAFILNPPGSNPWGTHDKPFENEQDLIMIQTCFYTWHMIAIATSMFVCCLVVGRSHRHCDPQVDEESMCLASLYDDHMGYKTLSENEVSAYNK